MLRSGTGKGVEMAEYASNNVGVINPIPKERLASSLQVVDVGSEVLPSHKILGLAWNIADFKYYEVADLQLRIEES